MSQTILDINFNIFGKAYFVFYRFVHNNLQETEVERSLLTATFNQTYYLHCIFCVEAPCAHVKTYKIDSPNNRLEWMDLDKEEFSKS